MTPYDVQEGRTSIFEKMPAVGNLDGLGSAFGRRVAVTTATIAADNLDLGMVLEPGRHRTDLTISQQVNDSVLFEIADNRSVPVATPPGKVIDADDLR